MMDFRQALLAHHEHKVAPKMEGIVKEAEHSLHRLVNEINMQVFHLQKEMEDFDKDPSAGASKGISSVKTKTRRMEILRFALPSIFGICRREQGTRILSEAVCFPFTIYLCFLSEPIDKHRLITSSCPTLFIWLTT